MVRDRGKKGRHGDTDRAIMLLVILRGESLPDGVPKRIIYEQIERNTGIDREGVKRRIKELTRNPAIQGILEETNRGGRSYFRVNVSNLYDLSRLYVFLMPALEASRAISSSIREYFDRHMNAFFTDFVDYFRLWKPFDCDWGMPPDFLNEPSLLPPGKEEDLEAVYIQADGQIVSEEIAGTYNAYREALVFQPEYYPDHGTGKIKWLLLLAIKGEGYNFIRPNLIDLLPAVKEVHEYFTEMENFHKDYVPPDMMDYLQEDRLEASFLDGCDAPEMVGPLEEYPGDCDVPLSAIDNDVVKAAVFSFIEKLQELSRLVPELRDYLKTIENMSYNPYVRMIRNGNATTWAFYRLYGADAEERDSDDARASKPIDAANEAVKKDPYAWMLVSGSDNHGTTLKRHAGKVSGEDVSTGEIYTPDF